MKRQPTHWVLVLVAVILVSCASGSTSPDPQSTGVIIPDTTKSKGPSSPGTGTGTVPPADTQTIIPDTTKVADPDSGALKFSKSTPVLATLKPGDVLVSEPSNAAPSGYLRKVTALRQDGTDTVLDTCPKNRDKPSLKTMGKRRA